jgi:hypothetical protein
MGIHLLNTLIFFEKGNENNKLRFFSANLKDNPHLKIHYDHLNSLKTTKREVIPNLDVKKRFQFLQHTKYAKEVKVNDEMRNR